MIRQASHTMPITGILQNQHQHLADENRRLEKQLANGRMALAKFIRELGELADQPAIKPHLLDLMQAMECGT